MNNPLEQGMVNTGSLAGPLLRSGNPHTPLIAQAPFFPSLYFPSARRPIP
jgi:hypothetical protein